MIVNIVSPIETSDVDLVTFFFYRIIENHTFEEHIKYFKEEDLPRAKELWEQAEKDVKLYDKAMEEYVWNPIEDDELEWREALS